MTKYASELPDFSDLLQAAAEFRKLRKLPAAIVEKDYYLTRALHSLRTEHDGEFILKGGTSLSKGWDLLDRFSEDLDILVRPEAGWGKNQRDTRLKALSNTIGKAPGLTLDSKDKRTRSETGVSRTCVFRYDAVATDLSMLGKNILSEAGYRGCPDAVVRKSIQSYLTEYAAANDRNNLAKDLQPFDIELQSLKRTFVEKLFAVHAAYCKDHCANQMRHYYDVSQLCGRSEVTSYVGTSEYRACVQDVRTICKEEFPHQAVPDTNSFSASPAFKPDPSDLKELERNYSLEAHLFFGPQPPLADVLARIGELLPDL